MPDDCVMVVGSQLPRSVNRAKAQVRCRLVASVNSFSRRHRGLHKNVSQFSRSHRKRVPVENREVR